MQSILTLLIVLAIVVILAILDMQRLAIRRYSLKGKDDIRILQLSDLHKRSFGKDNIKLLDTIKRERPDVLLFTGDLVSRDQTDFSALYKLISTACTMTKVYYVFGNHELDLDTSVRASIVDTLSSSGAILLDDSHTRIAEHTTLYGATIPTKCYHDGNFKYNHLYQYTVQDLSYTLGSVEADSYNILLAHNPFFFEAYAEWGASLTLSGHVHGGIVTLPWIKGLLSPERKFFPKYTGGEYHIGSKTMIVSRGLGKLRLFTCPEVSVIQIKKS